MAVSMQIEEALAQTPVLLPLVERAKVALAYLACIRSVLPAGLEHVVQTGPVDEKGWCLLVPNSAVATKLKQAVPSLLAKLHAKGYRVPAIQVRVCPGI
jgi:hypothetical protein